jgi:hypothetical protein
MVARLAYASLPAATVRPQQQVGPCQGFEALAACRALDTRSTLHQQPRWNGNATHRRGLSVEVLDVHAGGVTAVEHDEQAPWLQRRDVGGEVLGKNGAGLDPVDVKLMSYGIR